MTPSKIRVLFLAVLAVAFAATALGAQDTGKPIRIKAPKPQIQKFRGEVVHASSRQIIVQSTEDARFVRTFTYSPEVQKQMDKLLERGNLYQAGDKVEIQHEAGRDVALKIKGKPSKH